MQAITIVRFYLGLEESCNVGIEHWVGMWSLLSDISHDPGPGLVFNDDAQRVVEVSRIDPGGLDGGRGAAEQHHVLADDVERDDDGLADDRGTASTDEGLHLVVAGDAVAFLEESRSFIL